MLASEIDDLKQGRLTRDCPEMTLTNEDPERPRGFAGPGRLTLNEHGHLQLVLYDAGHDPDLTALTQVASVGEWVPESEIYDLEATDLSGRVWRSSNLTVGSSVHVARPGAVVYSTLDSLSSEADWEQGGTEWISLFFPYQVKAPRNVPTITTIEESDTKRLRRQVLERNIWAIRCRDLDVRMWFHDAYFDITVSALGGPLPQELPAIIKEVIWFILGQPVRADIIQYRRTGKEGIIMHSRGRDTALPSATPPYHIQIRDSAAVLGAMFCKYLAHVAGDRDGRYHRLSVLVRKALRAETGTLEERALARCVSIEGIVDLEFPDLGRPTDQTLAEVSALEKVLEERVQSSLIKSRVNGFLGSVRGRNSRTALHTLAEQGVITDEQLQVWETLRHAVAHGRQYQLPNRQVFELLDHLRVLMARLVFETIGYGGAYTDYGTWGWPVRTHRPPDATRPDRKTA